MSHGTAPMAPRTGVPDVPATPPSTQGEVLRLADHPEYRDAYDRTDKAAWLAAILRMPSDEWCLCRAALTLAFPGGPPL